MHYTAQIFPKNPTFWTYLWRPYYIALSLPSMIPFIITNSFSAAYPRISKFFSDVRNAEGAELPIGASGFCWGGRMVIVLAADAERKTAPVFETAAGSEVHVVRSLVDAVFTGHPSLMEIPRDLENVVKPLSIAVGNKDAFLPLAEVEKVKKALEKRKVDAGVKSEVVVFEGAGHGFAVRFDPGNEKLTKQSKETEDQALAWFEECFKAL
jgi:dienelactone hydrolase